MCSEQTTKQRTSFCHDILWNGGSARHVSEGGQRTAHGVLIAHRQFPVCFYERNPVIRLHATDPRSYDDRTSEQTRHFCSTFVFTDNRRHRHPPECAESGRACSLTIGLPSRSPRSRRTESARQQCIALAVPASRALVLPTGSGHRRRTGQRNRLSCYDFDDPPWPTILHRTTPLYPQKRPLPMAAAPRVRSAGAHSLVTELAAMASNASPPSTTTRLAHDRHTVRLSRRHPLPSDCRLNRHPRHALPQHRKRRRRRPPRAVRHHYQAVSTTQPRARGPVYGGSARLPRIHRRPYPLQGRRGMFA